jgi:hypothetical protein
MGNIAGHCPVCRQGIKEAIKLCPRCNTPHCSSCWKYNGKCAIYACGYTIDYSKKLDQKKNVPAPKIVENPVVRTYSGPFSGVTKLKYRECMAPDCDGCVRGFQYRGEDIRCYTEHEYLKGVSIIEYYLQKAGLGPTASCVINFVVMYSVLPLIWITAKFCPSPLSGISGCSSFLIFIITRLNAFGSWMNGVYEYS